MPCFFISPGECNPQISGHQKWRLLCDEACCISTTWVFPQCTTFSRYILICPFWASDHFLPSLLKRLIDRLKFFQIHWHILIFTNLLFNLLNLCWDWRWLPQAFNYALQTLKSWIYLVMKLRGWKRAKRKSREIRTKTFEKLPLNVLFHTSRLTYLTSLVIYIQLAIPPGGSLPLNIWKNHMTLQNGGTSLS